MRQQERAEETDARDNRSFLAGAARIEPKAASYVPRILSDRILRFANQFRQKNPCTFAQIEYILWTGGEFRRKRPWLAWLRRNR